ncbi:uncharacterized protein LY79DRAFT_38016 [Colletotrichum navitas]|uniref:Secreted protein n=1 Tax=Colletotrichum navitas TaxID=681940 RepID=A0AAD8Q789_9PEZI|nr:uncharacterized protein LY79DRAFT_38016 [Colletotrichum navitas]KAK1596995.1 hypothetical protein LY79DRAFT_38016 [Colletotrichum navitas]
MLALSITALLLYLLLLALIEVEVWLVECIRHCLRTCIDTCGTSTRGVERTGNAPQGTSALKQVASMCTTTNVGRALCNEHAYSTFT